MSTRGFTLVEMLVALALATVVGGIVATLIATIIRATLEHPRSADEQQRLRSAYDLLSSWIASAGEGLSGVGANDGWLPVPVLYPQRRGVGGADPDISASNDRLTILAGVQPQTRARVASAMSAVSAPVEIDPASCGPGLPVCGFAPGVRVLVADARAAGEWFTVTGAAGQAIEHSPANLSTTYGPSLEAALAAIDVRVLVFDAGRRQLRVVSPGSDLPVLDGVSGFTVAWRGDPRPPSGPVPRPGETNCVLDAAGAPRLPALPATIGPWADLSPAALSDGPWCGVAPWRYDADLFRVRMLRVVLQLDPTGLPGASRTVPPTLSFDVAPRNLLRMR